MANIFGVTPPKIIMNEIEYQLTKTTKGREETFVKEITIWQDLNRIIHERIKGYRLKASYSWGHIKNDDLENLLELYNTDKPLRMVFSVFTKQYKVRITSFKHGLDNGLSFADSAEIEFEGTELVKAFPNPDLMFTMSPMFFRGLVIYE
ncbi:MAG: hypothetical protein K8R79_07040 [Calditrichales bacterium]|nr:hypothetical protein [Calditrichales bacterium]